MSGPGRFSTSVLFSGLSLAGLAVVIAYGAAELWSAAQDRREFARVHEQSYVIIDDLRSKSPPDVETAAWNQLVELTVTAYANVCFSSEYVETAELVRFHRELRREVDHEVSVSTILWIWDRLAQTGPHGRRYVAQFRPQLLDVLEVANEQ